MDWEECFRAAKSPGGLEAMNEDHELFKGLAKKAREALQKGLDNGLLSSERAAHGFTKLYYSNGDGDNSIAMELASGHNRIGDLYSIKLVLDKQDIYGDVPF